MYGLIRTLLFRLPPEPAHNLALNALDLAPVQSTTMHSDLHSG